MKEDFQYSKVRASETLEKQRIERICFDKHETLKEWVIGLLVTVFLVGGVFAFVKFIVDRANTVIATEASGRLIDANFESGLTEDTTTVKTDLGTFRVYGVFQIVAGHATEIRTDENRDRRLCDLVNNSCNNLSK